MDEKKHIFRTGQRARLRRLATPKVETIEVQPNSQPPADNIGAPQPAPSREVEDQPNHVLPTDQADAPQPAKSREELEAEIRHLTERNQILAREKKQWYNKALYYKRKVLDLQQLVDNQKQLIEEIKKQYGITGEISDMLSNAADSIPADFFKSYCKRIHGSREREYSPQIRKFALTLQLCSLKAYR